MDATTLVITIGGAAMLLLILGGVLALYFGYRVFRAGVVLPEKAQIKLGKMQASGQGVGSVLMITAVAWAYAGVLAGPKFTNLGGRTEVVAFNTDKGKITAPTFTWAASPTVSVKEGLQIQGMFIDGAKAVDQNPRLSKELSVLGARAMIDVNDVAVRQSKDGKYQVHTTLKSVKASTPITFVAAKQGSQWVFTPDSLRAKNPDPDAG
jgi:hypothetical protein